MDQERDKIRAVLLRKVGEQVGKDLKRKLADILVLVPEEGRGEDLEKLPQPLGNFLEVGLDHHAEGFEEIVENCVVEVVLDQPFD